MTARLFLPDKFAEAEMCVEDGKAIFYNFRELSSKWIIDDDGVEVSRMFFVDELDENGSPVRKEGDWRWEGSKKKKNK